MAERGGSLAAALLAALVLLLLPGIARAHDARPLAVTLAEQAGAAIACSLWIGAAADTICLTPEEALESNTSYRARVDTLATDAVGNRLDQEPGAAGRQAFESLFETGSAR